jgi:undecaprenyl-diphosphatase
MQIDESAFDRWALLRLARAVTRRYREDWRALPETAWPRWRNTLAIGYGACLVLTVGLTILGRRLAESGALAWEADFIRRVADDRVMSFHNAMWFQAFGSIAMILPLLAVGAVLAALLRRPLRALLLIASFALAKILISLGWQIWQRPRPLFVEGGIGVPDVNGSFPSGHVAQTIVAYGLLTWFWMRASRSVGERAIAWLPAFLIVVFTVVGRLRVGAHWPSDIVAGLLIGSALLAALVITDWRAERQIALPQSRDALDGLSHRLTSGTTRHAPSRR